MEIMSIAVVGGGSLSEQKGMTLYAKERIDKADKVIYQSNRQGCYKEGGLSLDSIFEQAEDFDEFTQEAVKYILGFEGDVVFVAIGDGVNNNVAQALGKATDVELIAGHISDCVAKAASKGILSDSIAYVPAYDCINKDIDTSIDTVIVGIDDGLLFWDIKARLLDYYPGNTIIYMNKTEVELDKADYSEPCDVLLPKLELLEKKRYSYADLMDVVRELRQKCPWDREQDHKSIRTNLIEEAYEMYEAIDKEDGEMLLEEMGDVLLQVCLHNIFECEFGDVTEDEVTTLICQKLIRRHPHVYGEAVCNTEAEVKSGWDEIKKKEYSLNSRADELRHISQYLPALMRAYKTVKKAGKRGITVDGDLASVLESLEKQEDVKDNCGRLLLMAVKLVLSFGEHPYLCLNDTVNSFVEMVEEREKEANNQEETISIDINSIK